MDHRTEAAPRDPVPPRGGPAAVPSPESPVPAADLLLRPDSVAARRAGTADNGRGIARMLQAKLWENPCWLAFRLNYLALRYNTPLYAWIDRTRGLSRVEYVVIYSLGLADRGQARDISETSGFPKNTLSRAIAKLEKRGLILREPQPGGGRNQPLRLSDAGRRLFDATVPTFESFERLMLDALTPEECDTLAHLLAKVVTASDNWPEMLPDADPDIVLRQRRTRPSP
jgi:MarR family transcriptional regulator, temperature-dependent positive regulator of motility